MSAMGETITNCVRFSTIMFAAFLLRVYPGLPAPISHVSPQRVAVRADTVTFREFFEDSFAGPLRKDSQASLISARAMICLKLKWMIGTTAIHALEAVRLFCISRSPAYAPRRDLRISDFHAKVFECPCTLDAKKPQTFQ